MDTFMLPLAAFILTAVGWISREIWRWRKAKREATKDAVETLNESKTLLLEMLNEIEDASQKEELHLKLDEVNTALLGLHSERLRRTLKSAGLPPEEALIADGLSQLQPQQVEQLKGEIAELQTLPQSDSIWDLMAQGSAYYQLERYGEAKDIYSTIIDTNPHDHDAFQFRGATYIRLKKYKEAVADFNRSLELNPDDPIALHDRGVALRNLEKYTESLSDINRALELKPDHPIIFYSRGRVYLSMGKYEEALVDFNRSLKLKPDHPTTLYDLACLFSLWGKTDDALAYLEKAIAGDKKNRQEAKTDKDFDNIRGDPRFKKLIEPN